jgi:hypothetical protein
MTKKRTRKHELTRGEINAAIKIANNIKGAAVLLDCSYGTLYRRMEELGIKRAKLGRRRIKLTKTALSRYKKGFSWAQIGVVFNCSASTIRNAFDDLGIRKEDRRNKHETFWC